jgi:hypothetical protein
MLQLPSRSAQCYLLMLQLLIMLPVCHANLQLLAAILLLITLINVQLAGVTEVCYSSSIDTPGNVKSLTCGAAKLINNEQSHRPNTLPSFFLLNATRLTKPNAKQPLLAYIHSTNSDIALAGFIVKMTASYLIGFTLFQ